jgi:hypothetical protein
MELGRLREFNRVFGLRVLAFGVIALIGQLYLPQPHMCFSDHAHLLFLPVDPINL